MRKPASRRISIALSMALLAMSSSPVAAAGTVNLGNVVIGESATTNHGLPLGYTMSGLPPETVLYSGGDGTIDGVLATYGLTPPVTSGDVYATFGEATATFHLSLSLPPGTAFTINGSDCATGTTTCAAAVGFAPSETGPQSAGVTVVVTDLDVVYGPGYPSLIALVAGAIEPEIEQAIETVLAFTVAGTGTNGDSGGLILEVAVAPEPVPCLILDASSVDFGTLDFSTEVAVSTGSRPVTATSCSIGEEAIYAQGTDATGDGDPAAAWALSAAGGNPCAAGFDVYGVALTADIGGGPTTLQVSTGNAAWLELDAEASAATTVDYQMPCEGSSGAGQTMTSQITFLATAP